MAKAVNYTDEQVARMKELYTGADNKAEVDAIARELGKTPQSVRAKLSNLGVYVKAEADKAEDGRVTKRSIAERIGELVGLKEHEVEGLEKATKSALDKVLANLISE